MKKSLIAAVASIALSAGAFAQSSTNQVYSGNGNTSFGGAVGNGSLSVSNNDTGLLSFTYTRGSSAFNNAIVIYIDSAAGGATSTAGFTDTGDGLRRAIAGVDGGNRSTLNFAAGFTANYAIALNNGFAGLWSLSDPASFPFQTSANLLPNLASQTETSYTFSINVASIGLAANDGQSFGFFSTYISETAFRSVETFGATYSGSPTAGWNTFDAASSNTFTTVPEPSTYALLGLSAAALGSYVIRRRRR